MADLGQDGLVIWEYSLLLYRDIFQKEALMYMNIIDLLRLTGVLQWHYPCSQLTQARRAYTWLWLAEGTQGISLQHGSATLHWHSLWRQFDHWLKECEHERPQLQYSFSTKLSQFSIFCAVFILQGNKYSWCDDPFWLQSTLQWWTDPEPSVSQFDR